MIVKIIPKSTRIQRANTLIDGIGQIQNNGVRARSRKEFLISQHNAQEHPDRSVFISTLLPYTKLNVFIQQREISIKFLRTRKTKSNLYRCVSRVFPAASQNRRTLYINKKRRGGQGEASVGNPRGPNILGRIKAAKVTSLSNACKTHESFARREKDTHQSHFFSFLCACEWCNCVATHSQSNTEIIQGVVRSTLMSGAQQLK